jgi:hypothetical protein
LQVRAVRQVHSLAVFTVLRSSDKIASHQSVNIQIVDANNTYQPNLTLFMLAVNLPL